jgi:hypothetical protein
VSKEDGVDVGRLDGVAVVAAEGQVRRDAHGTGVQDVNLDV